MRDLEGLWKAARAQLVIPAEDGGNDIFLWEHSVRVAKSAHYLSRLPEAQPHDPDVLALLMAALFHEAGWVSRWRSGEIKRYEILLGSTNDSIIAESVRLMQQSLQGLAPPMSLQRAAEAIMSCHGHSFNLIESQLLREADSLEEFGFGFVWMAIRRGICGGKGVQAVLDAWRRRTEYQFWVARQNSFHFEASRLLATSRLKQLETLMAEMASQHEGEDVRKFVESKRGCCLTPMDRFFEPEKRVRQS